MLAFSIEPLALPVTPLLLMATVWLTAALARRWAGAAQAAAAENAVWIGAALGLLAARADRLLRHADAYASSPVAILGLRDGGWFAPAGWTATGLWRLGRAAARRALGAAAVAVLALRSVGTQALQDDRELPLSALLAGQPTAISLWGSWCGPRRNADVRCRAAARTRRALPARRPG